MNTTLRKCIATVALSGTLRDKVEACAAVGFDGVEIMEADLLTFDGSPADLAPSRLADVSGPEAINRTCANLPHPHMPAV